MCPFNPMIMKKPNKSQIIMLLAGIGLFLSQAIAIAQSPTYACDIRNQDFVSANIYEFDVYITQTGSTSFELANYQAGIQVNPLLINGGVISASIVSGSSGLLPDQQPTAISFVAAANCIRLAPKAPPRTLGINPNSTTNGSVISTLDGTKICRIRMTNSVAFGNSALLPVWSFTINPYNTIVSAFIGLADHKVNTIITNSADHGRNLAVKSLIEGPYDVSTDEMVTTVRDNGLVPLNQPFNIDPWNYAGTETVTAVPTDVVDWVLVDLRDASDPALADAASSKAIRALFLRKDGTIVGLDGVSVPEFNFAPENGLYAVVRHRNHIAIMSNTAIANISGSYTYDFTTSVDQAYGGSSGYKQIDDSPVKFGLVAGNSDSDGEISVIDFDVWATGFGQTLVYLPSDIDMDSEISVLDFDKWATNFGISNPISKSFSSVSYSSQVPK